MQKGYLVLVAILAYISCFAISLGPLTFVVIAEIFPTRARGTAMSVATFILWITVFIVSQTFPMLMGSIGNAFTFWIYMLMAVSHFSLYGKWFPKQKEKLWKRSKHSGSRMKQV
jgi:SP family arabinose:H+ symporter-like MFS transporter